MLLLFLQLLFVVVCCCSICCCCSVFFVVVLVTIVAWQSEGWHASRRQEIEMMSSRKLAAEVINDYCSFIKVLAQISQLPYPSLKPQHWDFCHLNGLSHNIYFALPAVLSCCHPRISDIKLLSTSWERHYRKGWVTSSTNQTTGFSL